MDIKWKIKRGFIRLVILNAVGSRLVLKFAITGDDVGETRQFEPLMRELFEEVGANVKLRFYGDKAYASNMVYGFCNERGIECNVPVKINAKGGSDPYGLAALEQLGGGADLLTFQTIPPDIRLAIQIKWLLEHDYGKRSSVEGVFSTYKRLFGEGVRSIKPENIEREVAMKLAVYNLWTLDGMDDESTLLDNIKDLYGIIVK